MLADGISTKSHLLTLMMFITQIQSPGKSVQLKLSCLFLIENICCVYSKELSQLDASFEHTKSMFKLINKKIITILFTYLDL